MQKETLEKLASEKSKPCVTISMNTHRAYPENGLDAIELKKLCHETEERLIAAYGKRPVMAILEKLEMIPLEVDENQNLDSLHIFLSETTKEIIQSTVKLNEDTVQISEGFALRPLIKSMNQSMGYLILLLSQSGAKLFEALNDTVVAEIVNENFPFAENPHFNTEPLKISDPKSGDNMVREFLNKVDKAMVKVYNQGKMKCVIMCTDGNYSRLMQVADKPAIYLGHTTVDFNNQSTHQIAAQAWDIVKEQQLKLEKEVIREMKEAVGYGKVITDLSEMYRAVKEGRGDLLIAHSTYSQAVKMTGEFTFELVDETPQADIIDDITNEIAWEVISKKGRVVFTDLDDIKTLGEIVLKVRY